jgi:hypothetical protein
MQVLNKYGTLFHGSACLSSLLCSLTHCKLNCNNNFKYCVFQSKAQTLFFTHTNKYMFVTKLHRGVLESVCENCFCAFDRDRQYSIILNICAHTHKRIRLSCMLKRLAHKIDYCLVASFVLRFNIMLD